MTLELRLQRLKKIRSERESDILRFASNPDISLRRKQILYACLNNLCSLSAKLFGDISDVPGNHDLLEEAAELDASLLDLRSQVGSLIPTRRQKAA